MLGFGQADDQFFHVLFNDGSNPAVQQASGGTAIWRPPICRTPAKATSWLSLSAGVRQTHFVGLIVRERDRSAARLPR